MALASPYLRLPLLRQTRRYNSQLLLLLFSVSQRQLYLLSLGRKHKPITIMDSKTEVEYYEFYDETCHECGSEFRIELPESTKEEYVHWACHDCMDRQGNGEQLSQYYEEAF